MSRIIAAALAVVMLAGCDAPAPPASAADTNASAPAPLSPPVPAKSVVAFIGTSLTAGYGVGADLAFPAIVQQKIDSAGLPYRVVNAGISGETSAGGLRRVDWLLQQPVAVLVLELGANDGLRGLDIESMKSNLDQIIRHTLEKNPNAKIVIAGMHAPPNLGPNYTARFSAVFRELAREHDAVLIPFLLEGVAGVPDLNQDDAIHPTEQGQRMIANTVWRYLEPLLKRD